MAVLRMPPPPELLGHMGLKTVEDVMLDGTFLAEVRNQEQAGGMMCADVRVLRLIHMLFEGFCSHKLGHCLLPLLPSHSLSSN